MSSLIIQLSSRHCLKLRTAVLLAAGVVESIWQMLSGVPCGLFGTRSLGLGMLQEREDKTKD